MTHLKEDYKVQFCDVDFTGKLSLNGICTYMQIIAANHASKLGFNYYKSESGVSYYWILARVKYEIGTYPKWEEGISMETYPGGYDKLYAVRLFDLTDSKGNAFGKITGYYVLMDGERHRPVKLKGGEGPLKILDFPYEGEKLDRLPQVKVALKEELRQAHYSELDLNQHMNNGHYIKWAMDMLPLEVFEKKEVASFEINYITSITWGTQVKVLGEKEDENHWSVTGISLDEKTVYFTSSICLRTVHQ